MSEWKFVDIGYMEWWSDRPACDSVVYSRKVDGLEEFLLIVGNERKIFRGETAWSDVERYASDKYELVVTV